MQAYRASLLHFHADPAFHAQAYEWHEYGLLIVDNGKVLAASERRNLRMVAGKVMMDRNCPEFLCDSAESGARDTEALIQRWHNTGRALYAITPRFAPTSTDAQLQLAGELARAYPDTFIQ